MSRTARDRKEWIIHIIDKKRDKKKCITFRKSIKYKGKEIATSKFVYESEIGPIAKGMVVSRKCNTLDCCNPYHLFLRFPGNLSNLNSANRRTLQEKIKKIRELRLKGETIYNISCYLKIPVTTVYKYVEGVSIPDKIKKEMEISRTVKRTDTIRKQRKKKWQGFNKFKEVISLKEYSKNTKANIAEAAVTYRLLIHDFSVYSSIFNGDRIDIIARNNKDNNLLKIQVKCIKKSSKGITPILSVKCMEGHYNFIQYQSKDIDFLIGYDIINDNAYVFSWNELKSKKESISVTIDSRENWNKLLYKRE